MPDAAVADAEILEPGTFDHAPGGLLNPGLPIPAYFLHGRHDQTVSYHLAKAYAGHFDAPLVGFYTFDHSAHSPAFEEPDRTLHILTQNVLTGTTTVADPTTEGIR